MKVGAPTGKIKVARRWLPWRRRVREVPDAPQTGLEDIPVINILALILAIPALVVLALLLVELLLLLILLPLFLLVRILLRAPWVVEVTERSTVHHQEAVKGWSASGAVRDGIASRLAAGVPVPTVVAEREAIRAGQAPEWSPR